jgi:hypothetical protein
MEGNLPHMNSMSFVKLMELKDTFQLEEIINKMEFLKGKIELSKKQYIQQYIYLTENKLELTMTKHHMSCGLAYQHQ